MLVDGASPASETSRSYRPPVKFVGVLLVIGIVGFAFATSRDGSLSAPEVTAPESMATVSPVVGAGIGDAIPGFDDALVAVARNGESLGHVLWPVDKEPLLRSFVSSDDQSMIDFDATGTFVAVGVPSDTGAAIDLAIGRPFSLGLRAEDVTSFSWHDRQAGLVSYTQEDQGLWSLYVAKPGSQATLVSSGDHVEARIAAFGDWGYALNVGGPEVTLLNGEASVIAEFPGQVLDSHPSGWLLIDGPSGLLALSPSGDSSTLSYNPGSVGELFSASFSPDLSQIAVLGSQGMRVSSVSGDGPIVKVPFESVEARPTWSTDSRYVVAPREEGLVGVDTHTGSRYAGLLEYQVVATSVIATD